MTKYIKIKMECILPVPPSIGGDLDAVAEAGLDALRQHLSSLMTTMVEGSMYTSWQSMPASWQPKRAPIIEEEVAPGFFHQVDSEERVTFVDLTDMPDPQIMPPPKPELEE